MGKVTIAYTADGFNMVSAPEDAATAADIFLHSFRGVGDYKAVGMRSPGMEGGGTDITGFDDTGAVYFLGWTGPISKLSDRIEYGFKIHPSDRVDGVRDRTIAGLNKMGFRPSFDAGYSPEKDYGNPSSFLMPRTAWMEISRKIASSRPVRSMS